MKLFFSLFFLAVLITAHTVSAAETPVAVAEALQDAFADVAEKSTPAVVIVTAKKRVGEYNLPPELQMLYQYFGRPIRPSQSQESVPAGTGSGFLIRKDGYIITNYHVITNADEVAITLHDGRTFNAKLVGTDWKTDLALLKIEGNDFPVLPFGNSDKARVGHWTIAIGAPFNLNYTTTVGIISQKGRAVGMNLYENYIQTDASINPGNSGGPLLNIRGELIGVNDFIVTGGGTSKGNIGLGFAIPSNMVKSVVNQLMTHGTVIRPYIGVGTAELNSGILRSLGIADEVTGVLATQIQRDGPADIAGIQPGDIITHLGKKSIKDSQTFQMVILNYVAGDIIPVTIRRKDKTLQIDVTSSGIDNQNRMIKPNEKLRNLIKAPPF